MYFVYDLDKESAKIINMETLRNKTVSLDELFHLYKTAEVVGIGIKCMVRDDLGYALLLEDLDMNKYSGFSLSVSESDYDRTKKELRKGSKIPIELCIILLDLETTTEDAIILGRESKYLIWYNGIKGVLRRSRRVRAIFIEDGILKAVLPISDGKYKIVELEILLSNIEKSTKAQFLLSIIN